MELSETIQSTRSDPERWVRRAQLSAGMGEFGQARSDLERALSLDPTHLAARLELMRIDAHLTALERTLYEQDPWKAVEQHGPAHTDEPRRRAFFETHLSRSVPSYPAVEAMAAWVGRQTVLEVGAGKGLWSRLLRDAGVELLATDHASASATPRWTHVMPLEAAEAVRTLAADVLLVEGDVHDPGGVVRAFRGKAILVRGPALAELNHVLDDGWTCVQAVQIPGWMGRRESVRFLLREHR
jgi:hypothetical protein